MSEVVIIVQARLGSTRLPGKVLKLIAGRPMLSYQIERLRRVKRANRVVIATTTEPADEAIVRFCTAESVECTRGPEHDVLRRYAEAARKFDARTVVRVTSDCPLIDPQIIDDALALIEGKDHPDYVSNMLEPTWPYGMAVEAFSARVLEEANRESTDPAEREHVTPFIYWRPQRYKLASLSMTPNLSHHRWTVDTPEDFDLIKRILEALIVRNPRFALPDVLALLEEHPDWAHINAHVAQKTVTASGGKQ